MYMSKSKLPTLFAFVIVCAIAFGLFVMLAAAVDNGQGEGVRSVSLITIGAVIPLIADKMILYIKYLRS